MDENSQGAVPPEVDVVVVGSGAAGMSAAITAARNGLSTILVEKSEYWGGSSSRSGVRRVDSGKLDTSPRGTDR